MGDNSLKRIDIDELELGMFVVNVLAQKGGVTVKTQGLVRIPSAVENLKRAGVTSLMVDMTRSEIASQTADEPVDDTAQAVEYDNVSFDEEAGRALKLYEKARDYQKRLFTEISEGKPVDLDQASDLADQLIDSVFRNQNALCFMVQMKDKDEYLYQHAINCSTLMTLFARHMDFNRDTIQNLAVGMLFHDVGKIHIPRELIDKPGELTGKEFELVKDHVDISWEIASSIPHISSETLDVIKLHHERMDGSGYPHGLAGEEINIYGRMAAIIDCYHALTSDRPYKDSVTSMTAFSIMKNGTPGEFDQDLLNQFIRCVGIYPVGTLVKLKSGKLAIVMQGNFSNPLQPKVMVFYSTRQHHHTEPKLIDLADKHCSEEIETSVRPQQFDLNLMKFFKQVLI
ncbi:MULTISPECIES: HD-GYP domain-containing protein [Corallincola]|uniref:HD-GYP domain-containing protein n=2 Tax=Corallincola TaxID=1775176 RepID=A0ABY1WRY8_9GAMM|nr:MULTISPECIES: HD-GYP domain-containing protein [Corallincola]TAA47512.1 HD-GYP domain-containing protein [Corallincola spongiicola]TCI05194.1 HD-GYP domain-containing protein [Corallincola luteus]